MRNSKLGFHFAIYQQCPQYLWWIECTSRRLISLYNQFSVITFRYRPSTKGLRPALSWRGSVITWICYWQIYICACAHFGLVDDREHLDRFTSPACPNDLLSSCFWYPSWSSTPQQQWSWFRLDSCGWIWDMIWLPRHTAVYPSISTHLISHSRVKVQLHSDWSSWTMAGQSGIWIFPDLYRSLQTLSWSHLLHDISAESVVQALTSGWISHYGIPTTITTNRGRQFESHLFQELSRILGIKHIRMTSYHSASNGMIECFHCQLKTALCAYLVLEPIHIYRPSCLSCSY